MEQMEIESSTKRVPKLTAKAQEDKLQQLKGARKAKLRYLTRKMKEIEALMDDANNAGDVNAIISGDFAATYIEFCAANDAVKTLMSDAQVFDDQAQWFEPKAKYLNAFVEKSESWLQEVNKQENEAKRLDAEIEPADSVSLIHSQNSKRQNASRPSSVVSSAVSSTVSATRMRAEAQKAALLARVGTLQKRVEIERQEALLKARREELELQTAIAAVNAKLEVLTVKESDCPANVAFREDVTVNQRGPDQGSECSFSTVLSEHDDFGQKGHGNRAQSTLRHSDTGRSDRPHLLRDMFGNQLSTDHGSAVGVQDLLTVMQRQNEITKLLVKQQKVSTLPPINIPVFSGNPLEFSFFLKAFEHGIEERTESNKDRLHFLEQFTQGRPKVLVRSCAYMNPDKGYVEAKRLLCKNFGNEYTIASAYIQKALQWPVIRSEDGDALTEFAVFLTSCCNTVDSVDYMNEMDSTTNMRIIISKLPFKIKEKWRGVACDIQEKSGKKVRFTDVVNFVDKQAKIASHPLFGNIQEPASPKQRHEKEKRENAKRHKEKKSVFATDVTSDTSSSEQAKGNTSADGIEKQCVFCQKKGHTLDCCRIIKQKPNKEKLDFLKSKGLCFGCLKQGHLSKGCKQKQICQTCSKKHPTILHFDREESAFSAEESQITQQTVQSSASTDNETCGCTGAGEAACALSIVPVKVRCLRSNRTVEAYAFLDPGSTGTFCTEELMRNLMTTGKKTNILLRTMGKEGIVSTNVVMGLEVSAVDEDNFIKLPKVFTQSKIPFRKENIPQQSDVDRWPYLRDVQLKRIDGEIGLLIGTNVPKALEPWKVINSDGNGPYAVKTLLGWTINGPLKEENASGESSEWPRVTVNRISVATLEELTERQIKLDFPEHDMAEKLEMSFEDKQFMDSVSNSVKIVDGHYSICLPFKNKDIVFPDNSVFAVQRAECLKRKLIKNPQLHQDYSKFMAQTLTNGYAQEVPTEDDRKSNKRTWYIPHHGVYHPTKHKLRVVFDCAATYRGTSLNSCLLQGPDLTSSLIGVLTRFRQEPIAFMADIEGMFNQVKVPQEDADVLRFLWWPQGDLSQQLKKYRMVVHIFGATSSPSCASYALRKCAEDNQAHFSSTAANTILRNFYVDDCLKSVGTEKQAIALIQDLEAMCAAGGFKLTKWVSNSKSVLASVREEERADKVKMLDLENDCLPIERALGVQWCVEADTLQFRVCIQSKPLTRRGVLSMVSTIYDPLGILAPIILPVKHILQELCRTKHAWDDDMPEALAMQWQQWVMTLDHLTTFEVKRCIKPANFGEITSARLHHFADASEKGYGVATYLVSRNCQNQTHCAFIMGKARVTPLKPVTIPRLELTAAVVAARMDKMIRAELDINLTDSIFWTDSTSVLQYLKNETTRYRTFVANRVAAIRDRTETSQWRYVNTSANPADYASRGLTIDVFLKAKTWIMGPDFISKPESEWPAVPDNVHQAITNDPEVKEVSVYASAAEESINVTHQLIHHYSSWYRLKRAVAWILRLKQILKLFSSKRKELTSAEEENVDSQRLKKQMRDFKAKFHTNPLSVGDMEEAERSVIRFSQAARFPKEIAMLGEGKLVSKDSSLYRLSPVFQDGVLRVGGRLNKASMQEESKHPVILASDLHITTLILKSVHEKLGHSGRNHVLAEVQQKYWILKSHAAVRKVLYRCVTCRRHHRKPESQLMADLPSERLTPDEPPFTSVGVDYFGPFEIKRGRAMVKRYGVIFTCLTVRAVHVEVANSLDTDSCIHALRRFIARRGQVKLIRSDNGKNFVSAERELREAVQSLDNTIIQSVMLQKGITWIFNPPYASHFGGIWERQIRTLRKILSSILHQQAVDEEGLHTLLCEVEAIINSRPISRISTDPNDLEALTPNHLLLMKAKTSLPPGLFDRKDVYSRRRWRQVQYLADLFWRRWTKEYLPDLQKRQKWSRPQRNISEDDIVLIVNDSAPRNSWMMGRVVETIKDVKGQVRQARVKSSSGVFLRPVTKLCLLVEGDM